MFSSLFLLKVNHASVPQRRERPGENRRSRPQTRVPPRISCQARCVLRESSLQGGPCPCLPHIPRPEHRHCLVPRESCDHTLLVPRRSQVPSPGPPGCVFHRGESPSNNAKPPLECQKRCPSFAGLLGTELWDLGKTYLPFASRGSCSSENHTLHPLHLKETEVP